MPPRSWALLPAHRARGVQIVVQVSVQVIVPRNGCDVVKVCGVLRAYDCSLRRRRVRYETNQCKSEGPMRKAYAGAGAVFMGDSCDTSTDHRHIASSSSEHKLSG